MAKFDVEGARRAGYTDAEIADFLAGEDAFDAAAARSYGLVAAAALGNGPHPRTRFADLLIAATAHTRGLDLYTRNIADFGGLEDLIRVVGV